MASEAGGRGQVWQGDRCAKPPKFRICTGPRRLLLLPALDTAARRDGGGGGGGVNLQQLGKTTAVAAA